MAIKICADCKKEFESDRKQLCKECLKKHEKKRSERQKEIYRTKNSLPKRKPKKHKPKLSFSDIIKIQEDYHRNHGVWLSYGKAVEMIERGDIECV